MEIEAGYKLAGRTGAVRGQKNRKQYKYACKYKIKIRKLKYKIQTLPQSQSSKKLGFKVNRRLTTIKATYQVCIKILYLDTIVIIYFSLDPAVYVKSPVCVKCVKSYAPTAQDTRYDITKKEIVAKENDDEGWKERRRMKKWTGRVVMMMTAVVMMWMKMMEVEKLVFRNMFVDINQEVKAENGNKLHYIDVANQNIPQGISNTNKEDIIDMILARHRPHLLGLAEPRYSDLATMHFPGYSVVPGIAIGIKNPRLNVLVKEGLVCEFLPFNTKVPSLLMKVGDTKILMLYREWLYDGNTKTQDIKLQEEQWRTFISAWKKIKGRQLVMGDCNFEYWRQETTHHANLANIRDEVLDNIVPRGFTQCVREDTRFQGKQKACLDHIYTNSAQFLETITNKSVTGYDHNMIKTRLRLLTPVYEKKVMEVRNIKNLDPAEFQQEFQLQDHDKFIRAQSVDDMVTVLVDNIVKTLDKVAPLRKVVINTCHAQYLTKELKEEMRCRDDLKKTAIISGSQEDWRIFKTARNKLRKKMEKARKDWSKKKVDEAMEQSDHKKLWSLVRQQSGLQQRKSSKIQLRIDGELEKDSRKVAEELSRYYVDKVNKIVAEHPPNPDLASYYTDRYVKDRSIPTMDFKPVTVPEVILVVSSLKSTNATGHDGISCNLLKKIIGSIAFFLTVIINTAMQQSTYPTAFKHGVISPVPKSGDMTEAKAWRPVVILPALSKPLEKILNHQMKEHLISNNLISEEQHAYQAKKSMATAWKELETITLAGLDRHKLMAYQLNDMSAGVQPRGS